jgi:hypothetical protein
VALRLFAADGTIQPNFIDGRTFDEDVVRTSADRRTGRPLRWDFDGDGRLTGVERRFTESDLFDEMSRYLPPTEQLAKQAEAEIESGDR